MSSLCPTCLGKHFVYSPGGYAPKIHCPTCGKGPIPKAAHLYCVERDQTIHALRTRLAHVEAFSTIELQNCARYVNEGRDSSEAATRGQELARMVLYVGRSRDD